ncbi:MAG: hypothetical protein ACE5RP_00235 [Nitrosopumilus sp.]
MAFYEVYAKSSMAYRDIVNSLNKQYDDWYIRGLGERKEHVLLRPEFNQDNPVFYALYKRDNFKTFAYKFPEFVLEYPQYKNDEGESINEEALDYAINAGVDYILILKSPGLIYKFSAIAWKKFCERYDLIRYQDHGEKTYSLPIGMLEKFEI